MTASARLASLCLITLPLLGCKGKVKVMTETKQIGNDVDLSISVDPPSAGSARLQGHPAFEKVGLISMPLGQTAKVSVPLAGVPMGKYTVTVLFTGTGRGLAKTTEGTTTFTFERTTITPTLKLKPVAKSGATDLQCKGDLCDSGTRLPVAADGKLSVDFTSCDGCTIDIAGQKIVVHGEHTPALVDLMPAIGAAPVGEIGSLSDMKIPMKITTTDGSAEANLEMLGSMVGGIALRRVVQGPLKFAGETAAPAKPRSAVFVRSDPSYGVVRTVGTASLVRDLDLVGVATASEQSLGSCGTYVRESTKTKVTVVLKGITYDVTMYDRRTGKSVGRRSFRPRNQGCADTLTSDVVYSFPVDSELDTWANTFFK